ncbi:hypothetical protein NDU88_001958 [Pleurodeles waltl]|uniref:Uncharacterized protein n=1 Tax=Pleurodeles waltl TaxID=8319 RepID=A0AAV7RCN7_PLEWA|nr:hypothetical protein NDU88_001958 [Pleurodeles waltl]
MEVPYHHCFGEAEPWLHSRFESVKLEAVACSISTWKFVAVVGPFYNKRNLRMHKAFPGRFRYCGFPENYPWWRTVHPLQVANETQLSSAKPVNTSLSIVKFYLFEAGFAKEPWLHSRFESVKLEAVACSISTWKFVAVVGPFYNKRNLRMHKAFPGRFRYCGFPENYPWWRTVHPLQVANETQLSSAKPVNTSLSIVYGECVMICICIISCQEPWLHSRFESVKLESVACSISTWKFVAVVGPFYNKRNLRMQKAFPGRFRYCGFPENYPWWRTVHPLQVANETQLSSAKPVNTSLSIGTAGNKPRKYLETFPQLEAPVDTVDESSFTAKFRCRGANTDRGAFFIGDVGIMFFAQVTMGAIGGAGMGESPGLGVFTRWPCAFSLFRFFHLFALLFFHH